MMQFHFCNPTEIVFGRGQIAKLNELVSPDERILLLYGGGGIKSNGVYDQAMAALKGYHAIIALAASITPGR